MQSWRFIPPLCASGQTQMALDAWLLKQHRQGTHPPALRFYTWDPIAISLGYHQRQWSDRWQGMTWQGRPVDLVRRPTGGRAVLHQGDLTYAVVVSGLSGSRVQGYRYLCEFLIRGWRSLGVELHYGQAGRDYHQQPNCFGTATAADLVMADGTKLIGSAQLRQGQAILQHGSIRLSPDANLFQQVFDEPADVPNFPTALQAPSLMATVTEALTQAAREWFEVDFQIQPLSATEWDAVLAEPAIALQRQQVSQ